MFSFKWPILLILLPLPWLGLVFHKMKFKQNSQPGSLVQIPISKRLQASFGPVNYIPNAKPGLSSILLYLTWCMFILSLMRPQLVNNLDAVEKKGFDIILGIDLSVSMLGLDFSNNNQEITRLDATKSVVRKFVEKRKDDRIGLIVFGEHAYDYVPLSYDKQAVVKMLDSLMVGMAGDSTAIGDAIGLAVKKLQTKQSAAKLFVLLTDGEDNASSIPTVEAAKIAKQYGIKIYTIGIGSDGWIAFRDKQGILQRAFLHLDENLLKQVAAITEGVYQRATNLDVLEKIYEKIDTAEKVINKADMVVISKELYQYPLGIGLISLLLGFLSQLNILPWPRKKNYAVN